ncbi:hypothetical protein [Hyphomonas sp.]|jgi:hypothetical protein|uniref:hypothetical protein n=1 Tax=Hyphomonas sp. TaxID=87 RepID=UPI0039E34703
MDIVKSDGLPRGAMPTVFEERTLFPPPQAPVIDAEFSKNRSGSVVPVLIFLFMLVPCAGLGYLVWQSTNQVGQLQTQLDQMEAKGNDAVTADLNAKIATLTVDRDALRVEVETIGDSQKMFDENIGRLVGESATLITEIEELLADQRKGGAPIPASLRTIPDTWDDAAIEILQKHVDALRAHKVKVIGPRPVKPKPVEGTISGTPQ